MCVEFVFLDFILLSTVGISPIVGIVRIIFLFSNSIESHVLSMTRVVNQKVVKSEVVKNYE